MAIGVPPRFGVPHLSPASVTKRAGWQDSEELRVSNWLTPWDGEDPLDAGLIGLPYSGASINPSGAYAAPESVRLAFRYNTTYSPDWDTDIRGLRARDLGDVGGHLTDVTVAHAKIEAAIAAACTIEPRFIPVMIGGDHSVTAPAVRGFCAANPDKRVGIINIDAHLDVRNFEHGPHNGTPFRAILTGDLPIEGRNVVELGIHGFMNAANYMQWAREQGVTVISGRDVQRRGMEDCIAEALQDRRGWDRPRLPERRHRLPGLPLGDRDVGHLAGRDQRLAADGGRVRLRAGFQGGRDRSGRDRPQPGCQGSHQPHRLLGAADIFRRSLPAAVRR